MKQQRCLQCGAADTLTHALHLTGSGFYASFRTPTSSAFRGLLLFFFIKILLLHFYFFKDANNVWIRITAHVLLPNQGIMVAFI